MSFFDVARERYSVRKYTEQPVEESMLTALLEMVQIAPTACNNQPQRIKIIQTAEDLAKVDQCTPCRFKAPLVLLICYDRNTCWKRSFDQANSGEVDASIVTSHIMLAAHELGLGSCWVMYFDPAKVVQLFDLPVHLVPVALLPIGYPAPDALPAKAHSTTLSLEELLF